MEIRLSTKDISLDQWKADHAEFAKRFADKEKELADKVKELADKDKEFTDYRVSVSSQFALRDRGLEELSQKITQLKSEISANRYQIR